MPTKRRPGKRASIGSLDKLLLLENQEMAKGEEAKMKQELLTQFLTIKLAREKQTSTLNLQKLQTQWRALLRKAKAKELHQDITILSQTFTRVMDLKDSVIESLVMDLEQAEEQHSRALRSHLHNIDRLLKLQRCRLGYLEEGYNTQLNVLVMEFEAERRTILEQHNREGLYLQAIALATQQNYTKNNRNATLSFQSAWDHIKNKSLQEKQCSRMELSRKAEVLWERFQHAVQSYVEATEHQKIIFEELKQRDEKSSREIEMQAKKLQKLQDLITATKSRMVAHHQESQEQNQHLWKEKERVHKQLQEFKREMKQAKASAYDNLAVLTVQSSATLKMLEQVVQKAQRILRLAEMCRRLETEEEKVLPFYPSSLAEEEQRDAQEVLEEMPTEPLAQAMRDYLGLEHFWQRFNKVKLEEQALEQQKVALSQRNLWLREMLWQYLEGFSVSQEVLSKPNPLLAIEHKSCFPRNSSHAGKTTHEAKRELHTLTPS